ncbi:MAG: flagellar biosynthetic protein FliO [Balneolaceae bacterium]|jgi:hypothetical protein
MIDWEAFKTQMQSRPKKVLGFVLGIAVCFLLIWMLVVLQAGTSGRTVVVDQSGRLDSLRVSLNKSAGDSLSKSSNLSNLAVAPREKSSAPFSNALPVFLILLAAIGGLWYWIKRGNASSDSKTDGVFLPVGTQEVVAGQQISVIKMNDEFWVLGTCSSGMALLHRYSEEDWNGPEASQAGKKKHGGRLFATILKAKQAGLENDGAH